MADGAADGRRRRRGPRPRPRPGSVLVWKEGPRGVDPPRARRRADGGGRPAAAPARPAARPGGDAGLGRGTRPRRPPAARRRRGSASAPQVPADVRGDLRALRDLLVLPAVAARAAARRVGAPGAADAVRRLLLLRAVPARRPRTRPRAASPGAVGASAAPWPSSLLSVTSQLPAPWSSLSLLSLLPLAVVQRAASAAALAAVPTADPNTRPDADQLDRRRVRRAAAGGDGARRGAGTRAAGPPRRRPHRLRRR